MIKIKKGQFAIEFVILIAFMLIVFLGFFAIVNYRLTEAEESEVQQAAENIASLLDNEIKLAKLANEGYERIFKVPKKIDGNDYSVAIIENRELVVNYLGYEHILFLPENVVGDVSVGFNKINKDNNIVYVSSLES